MNVIAWLEFELAFFDSAVQCFNHYTTRTPSVYFCRPYSDSEKKELISILTLEVSIKKPQVYSRNPEFAYECYIIKEWFFVYINHFSLIIFYHWVFTALNYSGLLVQVHSHWVQFALARKGYDSHHCHNKNSDRKWYWSEDDVMPRRDGSEIWGFWKSVSWDWTMEVENWVSAIEA